MSIVLPTFFTPAQLTGSFDSFNVQPLVDSELESQDETSQMRSANLVTIHGHGSFQKSRRKHVATASVSSGIREDLDGLLYTKGRPTLRAPIVGC